jgi:hypothetical protein
MYIYIYMYILDSTECKVQGYNPQRVHEEADGTRRSPDLIARPFVQDVQSNHTTEFRMNVFPQCTDVSGLFGDRSCHTRSGQLAFTRGRQKMITTQQTLRYTSLRWPSEPKASMNPVSIERNIPQTMFALWGCRVRLPDHPLIDRLID